MLMRFLGIDYGKKRIGIAVSDETGAIAFPHGVFGGENNALDEIVSLIKTKGAGELVLGLSLDNTGKENPGMSKARLFGDLLASKTGLLVNYEPEQFSTMEATRYLDNDMRDASSAAIILQRFLDKRTSKKNI